MAEEYNSENKSAVTEVPEEGFDMMGLMLDYLSHWKWFVVCAILALGCA